LTVLLAGFFVLGSQLRAQTHHRALGGVTFSIVALVLALGAALFARRIAAIARRLSAPLRGALLIASASMFTVMVPLLCFKLARAESPYVIDGLAFVLSGAFGAQRGLADRRALAMAGPPAAAVLVALGASTL